MPYFFRGIFLIIERRAENIPKRKIAEKVIERFLRSFAADRVQNVGNGYVEKKFKVSVVFYPLAVFVFFSAGERAERQTAECVLKALYYDLFGVFFFKEVAEIERHKRGKEGAVRDGALRLLVQKVLHNVPEIEFGNVKVEIFNEQFRDTVRAFCKHVFDSHIA